MSDDWAFRSMRVEDLDELVAMQGEAAAVAFAHVYPQDEHPFPTATVRERWRGEVEDDEVAAYVAVAGGRLVGFAARRDDELLHFGTALDTWGSGLADWLHDRLLETWPDDVTRIRAFVLEENHRGRTFYARHGWTRTGHEVRSGFAPYSLLLEHAVDRRATPAAG